MALIKKCKRGEELDMLESLKNQVAGAYNSADSKTQQAMEKLARNYQNFLSADNLSSRDARRLQIDGYKRLLDIANGNSGYNTLSLGTASTNIFGNYSGDEIVNIGNEITRLTFMGPNKSANNTDNPFYMDYTYGIPFGAGSSITSAATTTTPGGGYFGFSWKDKIDSDYLGENASLKDRATVYIEMIKNNIQAALDAKAKGKTLQGISDSALKQLPKILETLTTNSDFDPSSWDATNLESLDSRVSYLKNISQLLGIPGLTFNKYFTEWFDETSEYNKRKKLKDEKYKLDDDIVLGNTSVKELLKDKNYHIVSKDGKYYVYDQHWDKVTNPYSKIYDDATSDLYEHGIFINANGELTAGKLSDYSTDNPWYELILNTISNIQKNRGELINSYKYNALTGSTDSKLLKVVSRALGYDFDYADVSALFKGDAPVIVVAPLGEKIKYDQFGNIIPNDKLKYFYIGNDGESHFAKTIQDVAKALNTLYNYSGGFGEKGNLVFNTDLDSNIDINATNLTGSEWRAGGFWDEFMTRYRSAYNGTAPFWLDINDNPQLFVNDIIYGYEHPDEYWRPSSFLDSGKTFRSLISDYGDLKNIIPLIMRFIKEGKVTLDALQKIKLNLLFQKYASLYGAKLPESEKNGGIIKAFEGQKLDYFGNSVLASNKLKDEEAFEKKINDELILSEKAKESGYSNTQEYKDNQRRPNSSELSHTDFIRFGAMAADIASIPTSWVAGYGSAVSAGLGIGSSLATLYTDIADDGFQLHDITGLGINLAMDVAGVFTGGAGKIGKIIKTAIKYTPYMMASWEGIAHGGEYVAALKKLTGKEKMTVLDWKTLAQGVAVLAGVNRTAASSFKTRQITNNTKIDKALAKGDLDEVTIKVKEDGKVVSKKIDGEFAKQLKDAADTDEVDALLKGKFGDKTEAVIENKIFNKKKNPYLKTIDKAQKEFDTKNTPEDDVIIGAMLSTPENAKYLGAYDANRNWFSNRVNTIGRKYSHFGNDMDLAIGNVNWKGFKGTGDYNEYINKYNSAIKPSAKDVDLSVKPASTSKPTSESQVTPKPEATSKPTSESKVETTTPEVVSEVKPKTVKSINHKKFTESGNPKYFQLPKDITSKLAVNRLAEMHSSSKIKPINKANLQKALKTVYPESSANEDKKLWSYLSTTKGFKEFRADWNKTHPHAQFKSGGSINKLYKLQTFINNIK